MGLIAIVLSLLIGYFFSYLMFYKIVAYNPYGSELCIGKKGAGKSTYQAYLTKYYTERGWNVFCTTCIPGTYYISAKDIGTAFIPPHTVLLVDEAGIIFNNRAWKSLGMNVIKYFKYVRHYKVKIILFTQSDKDIDCTFMRVADKLCMIGNYMNTIGRVRYLRYKQVLIPASEMAEARITDDIVKVPIIFGGLKLYWMPRYWQYFDSYDQPLELLEKEFEYIPFSPFHKKFISPDQKRFNKSVKKISKRSKKLINRINRLLSRC